jgi:glycosyltransferase involved in cell wall biosynthesis
MHLGLVMQSDLEAGGAHYYESSFRTLFISACASKGFKVTTFTSTKTTIGQQGGSETFKFRSGPLRMVMSHVRSNPVAYKILGLFGLGMSGLEKKARRLGVDVLVFTSPNHISVGIQETPIVTTVWDFGHLDLPQASETALGGLWKWRQSLYANTLQRSVAVFCDSDSTADRMVNEHHVQSDRVSKVGLLPRVDAVVPEKFDLPHLIYPAMFWPHKNHATLLKSFKVLLERSSDRAYLVFTGQGKNEAAMRDLAQRLGVADMVKFEGLVSRERLQNLISGSSGLLMPSLLGPSNLPPLEAALLGTPCAVSDRHRMDDLIQGVTIVPAFDLEGWTSVMESMLGDRISVGSITSPDSAHEITETILWIAQEVSPWSTS